MNPKTTSCGLVMTAIVLLGSACADLASAQTGAGSISAAPAAPYASTLASPKPEVEGKGSKHKKDEYTGPTEIVELAPTPMLDEEGKQRLDPDGKPMFNAAVRQQRDKKGHPLFDEKGKPVFQTASELGYDDHGHKLHAEKVKPPKTTPVSIAGGTYTVDGVIGKAALNYEIADLKYIYLYAPGLGVAVVSNEPFPGATEQKNAFTENTLTVTVGEHVLQLASDKRLLEKRPVSAFVRLDRDFMLPSRFPVVGYGLIARAPYVWPGAKAQPLAAHAAVQAPPPPSNLMPVLLLKPCPAGQMRLAAPKVLPGQAAPEQPCVAIARAVSPPVKAVGTPAVKTTASATAPSAGAATPVDMSGGASE